MPRKTDGQVGGATVIEAPQVEPQTLTMSAMMELQVVEPAGYCPHNFNFNITHKLAKRFRMLKDSLHSSGVTFDDGNGSHHVDSDADVFRWWLASLEVA